MHLGINGRFYGASNVLGSQRFAREVTERIATHADVTVFLPAGVDPVRAPRGARVAHGWLTGHAWEQLEFPGLARRAGCDVTLHLSGTSPLRGGRSVMVVHDVLPLTRPHLFGRRFAIWYRFVLHRTVPRAAAVITVSDSSRLEILQTFATAPVVHVVTQGLAPFDSPAPATDIRRVRNELRLPGPFLLAVGHGDPRKNLVFLDGVLERLRRRGAPRTLVVTGEALRRVHGRARGPVGRDVRFVGHVDDTALRALYTGAEVLCFPSLAEGLGRPPLEAAACGTAALVPNRTALPDDARAAGLAVRLDAEAWADAIEALAYDPNLRGEIVRRGREAGARMDWDECARQVLDVCVAAARETEFSVTGRSPAGQLR